MNDKDFTSCLDILHKKNPDFLALILENKLSRAAIRRSLIIPPKNVIDALKSSKTQKTELLKYILRNPKKRDMSVKSIVDSGEGFLIPFKIGYRYDVTKGDSGDTELNGISIKLLAEIADKLLSDGKVGVISHDNNSSKDYEMEDDVLSDDHSLDVLI